MTSSSKPNYSYNKGKSYPTPQIYPTNKSSSPTSVVCNPVPLTNGTLNPAATGTTITATNPTNNSSGGSTLVGATTNGTVGTSVTLGSNGTPNTNANTGTPSRNVMVGTGVNSIVPSTPAPNGTIGNPGTTLTTATPSTTVVAGTPGTTVTTGIPGTSGTTVTTGIPANPGASGVTVTPGNVTTYANGGGNVINSTDGTNVTGIGVGSANGTGSTIASSICHRFDLHYLNLFIR